MGHFVLLLLWSMFSIIAGNDYDPNSIPHINLQKLKNIIASGNEEILVFFYGDFNGCEECKKLMPKYHEAVEYLNKLEDGKVVSYKMAIKFPEYGVNTLPQMMLFLKDTPFLYDGRDDESVWEADDILDWVEEAKQTPLQELTDETFEHLTQSSTGATTGDWIILFADRSRPECLKPYLPTISNIGLKLRRRKNAAFIDINSNPVTYSRFNTVLQTNCAAVLFFHRTELYKIPMNNFSTNSILKFVLEDYTYTEHVEVPKEHHEAHSQIDEAVKLLRSMLEEYTQYHTIHAGLLIILMAATMCIVFFLIKKFTKKKIL
uniref:thioredoxin domain-containing protein-like n=1 Tax=Styela clava TaxID=7725 RepID=UPI00193A5407|nr:thioredoxin domain-containing protein-like [Styela clava]